MTPRWRFWRAPDDEDDASRDRAAAELEHSDRLLREAQEKVILPLYRLRAQNNVSALARRLLRGINGG